MRTRDFDVEAFPNLSQLSNPVNRHRAREHQRTCAAAPTPQPSSTANAAPVLEERATNINAIAMAKATAACKIGLSYSGRLIHGLRSSTSGG